MSQQRKKKPDGPSLQKKREFCKRKKLSSNWRGLGHTQKVAFLKKKELTKSLVRKAEPVNLTAVSCRKGN